MATEKVTDMVLNIADLKCPCCYKKLKKLLCKFPQVRNQVFDEKQNTVSITVVCCNPEEIRHKLAKKGGKTVKSVEIKESPKPKVDDKKPDKPKVDDKKPDKPKVDDKKPDKPKVDDNKPDYKLKVDEKKPDKPKGDEEKTKGEAKVEKHKEVPASMMMEQVPIGYPYEVQYPGQPSGYGYGYGGGYVPVYNNNNNYGYRGEYYANNYHNNHNRPYDYLNEENPTGCAIM